MAMLRISLTCLVLTVTVLLLPFAVGLFLKRLEAERKIRWFR